MEAVGVSAPQSVPLDGKSLLPLLRGETTKHHEALFWSDGGSRGEWAVRKGDWKLRGSKDEIQLVHLAEDPAEQKNRAADEPERLKQLTRLFDTWLDAMAPPSTPGVPKRWGGKPVLTAEEQERSDSRATRKLERKRQAAEAQAKGK